MAEKYASALLDDAIAREEIEEFSVSEQYASEPVDDAIEKGGFEKFSKPWNNSDVILVVEEHKFHVHRAVLSIYSPVFLAMFSEGFSEKNKDEIPLPDKKALEFLDLLNQLYVDVEVSPVKMESVEHLLKLADEYQMRVVMERCRKALHAQSLTTGNALRFLILGQKYNFEKLRKKCYAVLRRLTLKSLQSQSQYGEMDEESREQVVQARLEESEKILPDIETLVWALLRNAIRLVRTEKNQWDSACEQSGHIAKIINIKGSSGYRGYRNYVARPGYSSNLDAVKALYNSCPQCESMFDSIVGLVPNVSPEGITERLKMIGVSIPG